MLITATLVAAFLSYTVFPHLSSRRSIPPQVDQQAKDILKEAQEDQASIYLAQVVSVSSSAKKAAIPCQMNGKSGWVFMTYPRHKCFVRLVGTLYGSQRSATLFLDDHDPVADEFGGFAYHHYDNIARGMRTGQYWVLVCNKESQSSDVFNTADSPTFVGSFVVPGPDAPEVRALRSHSLPLGLGRLIN